MAVLGAGPAGLTAAREAARSGLRPLVLESLPVVGGLSRTIVHEGYRFDLGGHRFLTRMPEIQQLWQDTLGNDLLTVQRQSRIRYRDGYLRYPLELADTLLGVGPIQGALMLGSYVKAALGPASEEATLEQWMTRRFGRRLYEAFFRGYTEKVWGIPCSEIQAEWASQRIQNLSLKDALLNAAGFRPDAKTLSDTFYYPRLGPGMMWERFAEDLRSHGGDLLMDAHVTELHHDGRRVQSIVYRHQGQPREMSADAFISSMPLDELLRCLRPEPPERIVESARGLRYRGFIIVQLAVARPELFPYHWIYVQTPQIRAGRVQNFGNWSRALLPSEDVSSVGVEYFATVGDDLWSLDDEALFRLASSEMESLGLLQARWVTGGKVVRHPKAYPVYDGQYRQNVERIRDYLGRFENLQTIGRAGMHRYNNLDHSMLTGILAARNLAGEHHDLWRVNADHAQAVG